MDIKYCSDFPDVPCCDSCHEDDEGGYSNLLGYPEYYVCCSVMAHIEKEKDNARTESPEE